MDDEEKPMVAVCEEFDSINKRGIFWGGSDHYFIWGVNHSQTCSEVREQKNAHLFGGSIDLLKKWQQIFASVQQFSFSLRNTSNEEEKDTSYLEYSKQYRESVELFLEEETEKVLGNDVKLLADLRNFHISIPEYSGELKLLENLKSLWHITDMLFVDPSRNITRSLIEWVQGKVEPPKLPTDEKSGRILVNHSDFWFKMGRLTLLGHYQEVLKGLYGGGALISPEILRGVEEVLRQDPSLLSVVGGGGKGMTESEYRMKFQSWQEDVSAMQETLRATSREGVGLVLGVLRGDPYVLQTVATCWEEKLIGQVRFCRPYVSKDGLWRLAEGCGEPPQPNLGLDLLCCPADEQEKVLQKTLIEIISMGCPKWFTVHLLDLLTHAIPHSRRRKQQDAWRERELLEYGTSIMQHPALGELAADYFLACPSKGVAALRALIDMQPIHTDDDAMRMLKLCDKFGFPELKRSICNQRGNFYLKQPFFTSNSQQQQLILQKQQQQQLQQQQQQLQQQRNAPSFSSSSSSSSSSLSSSSTSSSSSSSSCFGLAAYWMCISQDTQRISAICVYLCGIFMDSVTSRTDVAEGKCGICGEGGRGEAFSLSQGKLFHPSCLQQTALNAIASVVKEVGQNPENFNLHYHLPFLVHFQQLCELLKRMEELTKKEEKEEEEDNSMRSLPEQRKMRAEKEDELERVARSSLSIIVRALSMKVAPRRLWIYLLHSSVRLLETTREGQCLMNQGDTFKLMACLEELALSHWNLIKEDSNVRAIRLGLTRNLARAIKYNC